MSRHKNLMFNCTYVATMGNIVATKTLLAISVQRQLGRDIEKTRVNSNQILS